MQYFQTALYSIFAVVAGLVLPLVLIPVVTFTGYSEVAEEVAKALVVFFLILKVPTHGMQVGVSAAFGFLFGLSESMLYLNNFFILGDPGMFWQRLLTTVPMHMITTLVILFAALAGKKFIVFGLAAAIILHALFNNIAAWL